MFMCRIKHGAVDESTEFFRCENHLVVGVVVNDNT